MPDELIVPGAVRVYGKGPSQFYGSIELRNWVHFWPQAVAPTTTDWATREAGRLWFDPASTTYKYWDGAAVQELDTSAGLPAHAILSAAHNDTTAAAVVRGDIIIGSVAAPNTKWTRLAVGASTTYLAGGTEPSWATLNQAAVTGLTTADGPSFDHLHLTVAVGTAPLVVTSTTAVANLNADLLDSYEATAFALSGHNHTGVYEPALGNPAVTGYVLASTDAGVRSWVSPAAPGAHELTSLSHTTTSDNLSYLRGDKTWAVLNQAAVAGLTTASSPSFVTVTHTGNVVLPAAQVNAAVFGVYEASVGLIRTFKPTANRGYNLFIEGAGNNTMTGVAAYEASDNIAIGHDCLIHNTTGFRNIAIGTNAFHANLSSYKSIAIGYYAMAENLTGVENLAIGVAALTANTEGHYNVALGNAALWSNTTGDNNTALGYGALVANTGGSRNLAVGKNSLFTNLTGNDNVALGSWAGFWETGSKKLFIDNDARFDEADARAKALIYGVFAATTPDQRLYLNAKVSTPEQLTSTVVTGTAPLAVASTTVVTNLNADMLDGKHVTELCTVWSGVGSNPQVGEYRIKAMRLNSSKHVVIVYDETPEIAIGDYDTILSNPGSGEYRIKALRLNASKHVVVVYDETAEP